MDYFECLRLIKGFEKKDDKGKNKFLTYDEANNILRDVKIKIENNNNNNNIPKINSQANNCLK